MGHLKLVSRGTVGPQRSADQCAISAVVDDWGCGFLLRTVLPPLLWLQGDPAPIDTLRMIRRYLEVAAANPQMIVWRRPEALGTLFTATGVACMFGLTGAAGCLLLDLYAAMMGWCPLRGGDQPPMTDADRNEHWLAEAIGHCDRAITDIIATGERAPTCART